MALGALGRMFGVYDGHGGEECADYLVQQLHHSIRRCFGTQPSTYEVPAGGVALSELRAVDEQLDECRAQLAAVAGDEELTAQVNEVLELLTEQRAAVAAQLGAAPADRTASRQFEQRALDALTRGFLRTDRMLLQTARKREWQSGSTALCCVVHGTERDARLFVANVGDCRAVLASGGKGVPLTTDHKPDRSDEQRRIRQAGGAVVELHGVWRVTTRAGAGELNLSSTVMCRYLAVARSFGDLDFKEPLPLLSVEPETQVVRLTPDDALVVLACDGIYDVLSNQQVADLALQHLDAPRAGAEAIIKAALQAGSLDNVTATVIVFPWARAPSDEQRAALAVPTSAVDEELDIFG